MSELVLHEFATEEDEQGFPMRVVRGQHGMYVQTLNEDNDWEVIASSEFVLMDEILRLRGLLEEALDSVDDPDVEDRIRQALHREGDRS